MRTRRIGLLVVLVASLACVMASATDYPPVVTGYTIRFPADEGSHPAFRTEWWYVTGWLDTADGTPLGFQVTFFRTRPAGGADNPSQFAPRQLLFAHVALSDARRGRLLRDEKAAREGFGLAASAAGALDVHLDDWSLRADGPDQYRAQITASELTLDLRFRMTQPPLLHGEAGFSQKSRARERASYYYSLVQLETTGRVRTAQGESTVRGVAWFDHEWSSEVLDPAASGWDWVGINFDDGSTLAASRVRTASNTQFWAGGTTRAADGSTRTTYAPEQIAWLPARRWRSPRTGIEYPVEWRVCVGERTVVLRPLLDDQENDGRGSTGTLYWEGAVRAFDLAGHPLGRGYLELTGYGPRMNL